MTFSGNFMPKRFGKGNPKPKVTGYSQYVKLKAAGPGRPPREKK